MVVFVYLICLIFKHYKNAITTLTRRFNKTYQKKGLAILGIALDDKEKVSKFAKDYNINYPIVIGDQSISALYGGITGIPTTFIIDRKGVIKAVHVGYKTKDVFEKEIKALL